MQKLRMLRKREKNETRALEWRDDSKEMGVKRIQWWGEPRMGH